MTTPPSESGQDVSTRMRDAGAAALERIGVLGLAPVPQVYELWFRYFQGDPDVVKEIENHQGQMTEQDCLAAYNKLLGGQEASAAVGRVTEQVQTSIAELATMLGSVRHATSEYGETLDIAKERIDKITTADELQMVVSTIVRDTKKMVEKNQELEIQLVNSSKQVTALRRDLDEVKREAQTDGLTGINNRKSFDNELLRCMRESEETGAPMSLLLLDIDHFKNFNDQYGHQVGDQVLRLVAKTLIDNVKGRDVAARYGGEEFAIILPETPLKAALIVAESLRRNVESKEVVNKATSEHLGRITLSIGVAEYTAGEAALAYVDRTDTALYNAKNKGRNCVVEAAAPETV